MTRILGQLFYTDYSTKLTQLVFQSDGDLLASADADGFLFLWDPNQHDKVIGGVLLSAPASCLRWCEGDRLAVGQEDGKAVVFTVRSAPTGTSKPSSPAT